MGKGSNRGALRKFTSTWLGGRPGPCCQPGGPNEEGSPIRLDCAASRCCSILVGALGGRCPSTSAGSIVSRTGIVDGTSAPLLISMCAQSFVVFVCYYKQRYNKQCFLPFLVSLAVSSVLGWLSPKVLTLTMLTVANCILYTDINYKATLLSHTFTQVSTKLLNC